MGKNIHPVYATFQNIHNTLGILQVFNRMVKYHSIYRIEWFQSNKLSFMGLFTTINHEPWYR